MKLKAFTFNDFYENTYICYDDTGACIIMDPGCHTPDEKQELASFIKENKLTPNRLVNTHCHIDHVLGNAFVADAFGLELEAHRGESVVLDNMDQVARMYGIPYEPSPPIRHFLEEGELKFGETTLEMLFTPGHSPASLSFFHRESRQLIAGDVLFRGSIGRTDLPGGDFDTLIASIKNKLLPLGDDVVVYSGHGPHTTIGEEKRSNPFLVNV